MATLTAFGHNWNIREDQIYAPYMAANVTSFYQAAPVDHDGAPIFTGTRRIGLAAPEGSAACIEVDRILGYGTYEVTFIGRPDAFDPSICTAVWTHHNFKPEASVEIDAEFASWRDQNRSSNRVQLGVFVGGKRPVDPSDPKKLIYPTKEYGVPSYYYHKVILQQFKNLSRVTLAGWWELEQEWHTWAFAEWNVPTPEMGHFKIGIGPMSTNASYVLPKSASLPARIAVAGFSFTAA